MSHSNTTILLLGLLVLPFLSACTHPKNARLELGALSRTPTFAVESDPPPLPDLPDPSTPRSHWSTTVIIAPIDGIAHNPALRIYPAPRRDDHPRTYGLYPTAESALDHQTTPISRAIPESIDELGVSLKSLVDPVLLFYEMTSTPWSPRRVWKRTEQDNTWSSGQPPQEPHND